MTGYTVHTGSSDEFAQGWDRVFGEGKRKEKQTKKKPAKAKAKKPKKK
jgi:hypothetical protein